MMNKTVLMLSVSCMPFIAGADLCYAGFNPDDTPLSLSPALLKSHVSTHTSHLTAGHLSSLEDFAELTLPENSGRDREGFKPSLTSGSVSVAGRATLSRCGHSVCNAHFASLPLAYELTNSRLSLKISPSEIFSASSPKSLGREEKTKQSSSGLTRGSRWNKSAALSDLDTPIKLEYDIERNTSSLRGEGQGEGDNNNLIQLAAACFVTDITNCSGNEFVGNNADEDNGGVPPGGGDDYELDDEKRCEEEGYTKTSCPEGYEAVNFCPYDNRYFEYCRALCPSDYVTCEPPYHGVGEACDGKYASCECTPCGAGYDYTTIPEGYVQDGEACLDCDGKTKYKIKPNPCEGYMDCGSMGPEAGANTCQSGTEIKYDNCKPCPNECSMDSCPSPYTCKKEECSNKYCKNGCQSGYVWNASSQTCTCDSSYKYTCSGANETGGSGSSCDGKYQSCRCASGYVWKNGICEKVVVQEDKGCTANCQIGDIFFSDGSCGTEKVSGKTPVGVVVYRYKSRDKEICWAMALKSIGAYQWGDYGDIGDLPGYGSASAASGDFDSCGNTDKILDAGNHLHYPAAWAADGYSAGGMSAWCLPAAGIMYSINNNMSAVNAGFLRAGGVQLGSNSFLWTSTEYTADLGAWRSFFGGTYGLTNYPQKDKEYDVRPVIEF